MKVVYTAPNRAHHYKYALALYKAGILKSFVSGFSRFSPRAALPDISEKLHRADIIQTAYLASLKFGSLNKVSSALGYLAKIEQDLNCRKYVKDCDIFLYYSGSGLISSRYGKQNKTINIVEAVNSHIEYQEEILQREHKNALLDWKGSSKVEKERRLREYEEADYILLPSEFVRKSFIKKGFPEEKLLKVTYGFNKLSGLLSPSHSRHSDNFTILYVGTISVRKGLRYLIEAFKQLNHPKKKLIIVGPDAKDGALRGVTFTDNIILKGVLKGEELENVYKSADIFCLPSIEEGLALVLGEAISFGLPLIATRNSGADDLIVDGREGFIVPIADTEAILQKLQILLDNPDLLQQMRSYSVERASELNGWEVAGNNLVNTLSRVFYNR